MQNIDPQEIPIDTIHLLLNTVPTVRAALAANVVVRFQKTPKRKTAAIGGAMNPNTDWKTLNKFSP